MAATTSQGTGHGAANKPTTNDLAVIAQTGPYIVFAGYAEGSEAMSSPPGLTDTVIFPYPLDSVDNYVVMLTSLNAGSVYVTDLSEDETGFYGFEFAVETDGTVMYAVVKVGARPQSEA